MTQRAARAFVMSKHVRSLLLATRISCKENEALTPEPPPPRFARYASSSGPPPPLSRGRMAQAISFPRRSPRPSFADQSHQSFASKKIRGGGAPKRRNCPVGPRHASDVAIRLRFGRGRASSGTRSPFGAPPRRSPRPCAEARSRPRVTRGRCPDRPRTEVTSFRPQEPHPPRQSASPVDVPYASEISPVLIKSGCLSIET